MRPLDMLQYCFRHTLTASPHFALLQEQNLPIRFYDLVSFSIKYKMHVNSSYMFLLFEKYIAGLKLGLMEPSTPTVQASLVPTCQLES